MASHPRRYLLFIVTAIKIRNPAWVVFIFLFIKTLRFQFCILLGDFNAKVGREVIFKPAIGSESLHEISNDNGVRVVNVCTSEYLPTL
jgi:hypothetical protein